MLKKNKLTMFQERRIENTDKGRKRLKSDQRDMKKSQIELLEMKNVITETRNSTDGREE